MSVTMKINDSRAFDRTTASLVAGGLVAGAVTATLSALTHASAAGFGALCFGAIIGLASYLIGDVEDDALIGLLLSVGGGVVLAAGLEAEATMLSWGATGLAGSLIGLGVGARQFDSRRRIVWTLICAASLVAARFTTAELLSPDRFAALQSTALPYLLSSSIWGLFMAGAVGTGFVRASRDEVLSKLDRVESEAVDPVREHVVSAKEVYEKIVCELERDTSEQLAERARAITDETTDALAGFAKRFSELKQGVNGRKAAAIRRRAEALDERIDCARSSALAAQLQQSRREIDGQIQIQEELELACARIEARSQRCVTMLERLHVSLVHNASGEMRSAAMQQSFEELEHLADEVQMKSMSIEELLQRTGDSETDPKQDSSSISVEDVSPKVSPTQAPMVDSDGVDGADGSLDEPDAGSNLTVDACTGPDDDVSEESSESEAAHDRGQGAENRESIVETTHESC